MNRFKECRFFVKIGFVLGIALGGLLSAVILTLLEVL